MKTIEYKFKNQKINGPWDNEPDKVQFSDVKTGLPCLIVRNNSGALCGYVGIDKNNQFFKKPYDEVPVNVHGGLTFSDFCQKGDPRGICHIVEPGEPEKVWWLGFDCAHFGDFVPGFDGIFSVDMVTYKDINYVKEEIASLAEQLNPFNNRNVKAAAGRVPGGAKFK